MGARNQIQRVGDAAGEEGGRACPQASAAPGPQRSLPGTATLTEPNAHAVTGGEAQKTDLRELCSISLALKYRDAECFITPLVSFPTK